VAKDFLPEGLTDGVQIDQIDFVECGNIIDGVLQRGHLWERNGLLSTNGNIDVGMGSGGAFDPRTEPEHFNIRAEDVSRESRDLLRNLPRPRYECMIEHAPSVAVLAVKSTAPVLAR
jgi:hypothetical protein